VAVETAIVLPLFLFIILGMLQLGLLHQARVMTKYAAYKAVRVGALHSAKKSAMTRAALAVLLPYAGRRSSVSFFKATPDAYGQSFQAAAQLNDTADGLMVKVTVCDPIDNPSGDFDDPEGDMGGIAVGANVPDAPPDDSTAFDPSSLDWQRFNHGRLSIQVTFLHQMVIPFVNGVLWHVANGTDEAELLRTLRLGNEKSLKLDGNKYLLGTLVGLTNQDPPVYLMPIRAGWSMRMQSNYLSHSADFKLPTKNECVVPWTHP
jgi:TadE-like protein